MVKKLTALFIGVLITFIILAVAYNIPQVKNYITGNKPLMVTGSSLNSDWGCVYHADGSYGNSYPISYFATYLTPDVLKGAFGDGYSIKSPEKFNSNVCLSGDIILAIGDEYSVSLCSGNGYICPNSVVYSCENFYSSEHATSCSLGCDKSTGLCVPEPTECTNGQFKCDGFVDYYCGVNNIWTNMGTQKNACGVECLSGEEKCTGFVYYTCYNYKFLNAGVVNGKCGYINNTPNPDCYNDKIIFCDNGTSITTEKCINGKIILTNDKCYDSNCTNGLDVTGICIDDEPQPNYILILTIILIPIGIILFLIFIFLKLRKR